MRDAARLFHVQTAGCRPFGHLRYGGQHGGVVEADFHVQPPQQVFRRLAVGVFHRVRQHAAHARHRFGLAADDKTVRAVLQADTRAVGGIRGEQFVNHGGKLPAAHALHHHHRMQAVVQIHTRCAPLQRGRRANQFGQSQQFGGVLRFAYQITSEYALRMPDNARRLAAIQPARFQRVQIGDLRKENAGRAHGGSHQIDAVRAVFRPFYRLETLRSGGGNLPGHRRQDSGSSGGHFVCPVPRLFGQSLAQAAYPIKALPGKTQCERFVIKMFRQAVLLQLAHGFTPSVIGVERFAKLNMMIV